MTLSLTKPMIMNVGAILNIINSVNNVVMKKVVGLAMVVSLRLNLLILYVP